VIGAFFIFATNSVSGQLSRHLALQVWDVGGNGGGDEILKTTAHKAAATSACCGGFAVAKIGSEEAALLGWGGVELGSDITL
jgi:hypothetical protein